MKWKIKELEDAVRSSNGDRYGDKIHKPLKSFHLKSMMAYYHADESERIIKDMLSSTNDINKNDSGSTATAKAIFLAASSGNKGKHILEAQFKAESHIIASAQALHSISDILAIIAYWTLKLDNLPNPIPFKKINLYRIKDKLDEFSEYYSICNLIYNTLSSPEFKYLAAYVNTTKHNSLINSVLSVSFKADKKYGMRIKEFSYENYRGATPMRFDKKWSNDFLNRDSQTLRINLMKIGNSLNNYFK